MSNVELNSCTVMVNTLHLKMYHLSHVYQNLTECTVSRSENKLCPKLFDYLTA